MEPWITRKKVTWNWKACIFFSTRNPAPGGSMEGLHFASCPCFSESGLHLLISERLCAGSSAEGARQQLTIYFFLLTVFLLGSGISMQLPCQHHFRPFLLPSPSLISILPLTLFLGPFWPTAQIPSLSPLTLEKRLKHPRRLTMQ